MAGITRRQARILRRQIKKLYGREYIPLISSDSTISIGDILVKMKDMNPVLDRTNFTESSIRLIEGAKVDKNITSGSGVNIITKLQGEAVLTDQFRIDEAGISVEFTSDNQMFLKVKGLRQLSLVNFVDFKKELLQKYFRGDISPKVYVVRGLLYADKYFLQYSGKNGGSVGFNLNSDIPSVNTEIDADFSIKWQKNVGFNMSASDGGVLGYRVSGVRLKRQAITEPIQMEILNGMSEAEAIAALSQRDKEKLLSEDAFEIVDLTDEILVAEEEVF